MLITGAIVNDRFSLHRLLGDVEGDVQKTVICQLSVVRCLGLMGKNRNFQSGQSTPRVAV